MTSYTHRLCSWLLGLALAAAGAACGSEDRPAAAPTSATGRPQAPYGTYARQVTRRDVARTARSRGPYGPHQQAPPAGRYRLVIAKGSAQDVLKATDPGGVTVAMGVLLYHGDLLLTNYVREDSAFCGFEYPVTARYAFRLNGAALTLEPRHRDGCPDRDSVLTGTWHRT